LTNNTNSYLIIHYFSVDIYISLLIPPLTTYFFIHHHTYPSSIPNLHPCELYYNLSVFSLLYNFICFFQSISTTFSIMSCRNKSDLPCQNRNQLGFKGNFIINTTKLNYSNLWWSTSMVNNKLRRVSIVLSTLTPSIMFKLYRHRLTLINFTILNIDYFY
jgi:hypothetical protein